ncbi:hypothetical protein AMECASPLE_012138 [Ameca splendens]|uniref:Uncharacterized protein n=1 Tax=Ameca splendens TaxID=208324 RepID=A0ABV1A9E6_9TELE
MKKKVTEIFQSGMGYKAFSKALGLQRTSVRDTIHKGGETWKSGEPYHEWLADQNYIKSAFTTHPRGQKRPHNIQRTAGLKETWQKWPAWQSSKTKTTAEQK